MVSEGASDPVIAGIVANDKTPWYKKPNLRMLYLFLVPCTLAIEATGGFDASMMNGLQSLKYWQAAFDYPQGSILGILTASYNLGAITALPFVSILSDHVGRRWAIMFGSLVMVVGAILQCFSVNITMWVFARIFLGHGFPYCVVAGSSLIGELAHPKERGRLGSLFNAFYFVGALLAAGITLETLKIQSDWSWKLPSILQMAPSILQIAFIFFIPESPRWLLSKDRGDEALSILIKYHDEVGPDLVIAHIEFEQMKRALEMENKGRKRSWAELFQSPGMRRRSLIAAFLGLFTQFSGNTLISAYLVKILKQIGFTDPFVQNQINVGLQGWNMVVAFFLALVVSKFPRRTMYLLCASCLLCVYTGWTIAQARQMISGSYAAGITVIAFMFLYQLAYSIGYNALTYVYLVELFPYFARTKGISWFQLFGKGAGFFSTFVNPIALDAITWRYLIVYIVWLAFEILFIYFLFPETHNRTLEELAFLFEDQEAKDAIGKNLADKGFEANEHIEVMPKGVHEKV